MADFNKPQSTDQYLAVLAGIRDLVRRAVLWLDPIEADSNTPANAKRFANNRFEKYTGANWVELIAKATGKYDINVDMLDGFDANSGTTASTIAVRDANGKLPGDVLGNAATSTTAGKLANARTIAIAGDAAGSANFDGSANTTLNVALANSGVTAGAYGGTGAIPVVTVNAKGQIINISTAPISVPVTSVFGRTGAVALSSADVASALGFTPPAASSGQVHELYNDGWYRSQGAVGWYNETYGGGIRMTEAAYVSVYGGKGFKTDQVTLAPNGNIHSNAYGWIHDHWITGSVEITLPDIVGSGEPFPNISPWVLEKTGEAQGRWRRDRYNNCNCACACACVCNCDCTCTD